MEFAEAHLVGLLWAALALGGILKGATGAGAPIVAVPLLSVLYNVPLAIVTLLLPSLFSNAWQAWRFRSAVPSAAFVVALAVASVVGVTVGSFLLVYLPSDYLLATVSGSVFLYIAVRLAHPQWVLPRQVAGAIVVPVGFVGGVLQGAAGISAPVSITFLNAMRMRREEFIATISTFFFAMSLVQIPVLVGLGVMDVQRSLLSLAACVPLFGAMPVGAALARRISREAFDRIMLAILAVMALRLIFEAVAG